VRRRHKRRERGQRSESGNLEQSIRLLAELLPPLLRRYLECIPLARPCPLPLPAPLALLPFHLLRLFAALSRDILIRPALRVSLTSSRPVHRYIGQPRTPSRRQSAWILEHLHWCSVIVCSRVCQVDAGVRCKVNMMERYRIRSTKSIMRPVKWMVRVRSLCGRLPSHRSILASLACARSTRRWFEYRFRHRGYVV